jgi:hypothetical protein
MDDKSFATLIDDESFATMSDHEKAKYLDALAGVPCRRGELAAAIRWQKLAVQFAKDRDLAEF